MAVEKKQKTKNKPSSILPFHLGEKWKLQRQISKDKTWDDVSINSSKLICKPGREIPLLAIYLEKTPIWKDICTPFAFTLQHYLQRPGPVATFVPMNRRTDKEDEVYTHNGIFLSYKKGWNNAICSNIGGPRDGHTKGRKSDREWQIYYIASVWNIFKKMIQMNLFTNQK